MLPFFDHEIFPNCLKIAKVIPILKNGSKSEVTNYQPISLLLNFSKILEKLIISRLMSFFEKYNILNQNQYGFQKNSSTTHAILDVVSRIANNIKQKKITRLIFLKKAFDTVSHEILLK